MAGGTGRVMTMHSCQKIPSHVRIKEKGQQKRKKIPTKAVSPHPLKKSLEPC